MTTKTCNICNVTQDIANFYLPSRGYCKRCECDKKRVSRKPSHRRWSKYSDKPKPPKVRGNIRAQRARNRLNKYGISKDQYSEMLASQSGRCAICDQPSPDRALAIDHDHVTGKVRGLLCYRCNCGIGLLQDNPNVLLRAVQYLINSQ